MRVTPMAICGILGALGSASGAAELAYDPANDAYYEVVEAAGITWHQARDAAQARSYRGSPGHLVTITSEAENAFLVLHFGDRSNLFIGASDEAIEGEWRWVTGPEAGTVFWLGDQNGQPRGYARWNGGEPNNCCDGENYAEWLGTRGGAWNDVDANIQGASAGYLVEYPANGIPPIKDCNGNGIDDAEDILLGTSPDGNFDGVPDECQLGPQDRFRRGDANADGVVDLSDGIWILSFLFLGDATLRCKDAADADDDEALAITDALAIFRYLFLGAPPPPSPGPFACGYDAVVTGPWLDCGGYPPDGCVSGPEGSLQGTLDELLGAGAVDAGRETRIETFPPGTYRLTLLAKRTGEPNVPIGVYSVDSPDTLVEVFPRAAAAGATGIVEVEGRMGLWVDTFGLWRSETRRNWDGFDHFLVFDLAMGGHVATIEDVNGGGDGDYQGIILRVQMLE